MIAFIFLFTLLVNQFNYVPYTVLDDMDIVVNEAEKSLGLWNLEAKANCYKLLNLNTMVNHQQWVSIVAILKIPWKAIKNSSTRISGTKQNTVS